MRNKLLKGSALIVAILLTIILTFGGCAAHAPEPIVIRTHTDLQAAYLADAYSNIEAYAEGTEELSRPLPATIVLSEDPNEFAQVEYSESPRFKGAVTLPVTDGKAEIYNLKTNVPYYYRGIKPNGKKGEVGAIIVENALPRNLYISGVTNARDLGGYQTKNGRIKQGMLYRTAKLNKNKTDEPVPLITEKGIYTMLNTLKVKTEVDLRRTEDNEIGSLTASVLGPSVNYVNCPMSYGTDMPIASSDSIRKVFSLLAKEENYPLFFHCSIGTDRTGFLAYLMLLILEADKEDVFRDYLFSNFGNIGDGRSTANLLAFSLFLATQGGKDLYEMAENYLLDIGVTSDELRSFRRIMLER